MLFKIVILVTYIFEEGPWPAPLTEHLGGVDFGPNIEWHDAEVTGMPVWDFPNPPFGKEICHHLKWDQITQPTKQFI